MRRSTYRPSAQSSIISKRIHPKPPFPIPRIWMTIRKSLPSSPPRRLIRGTTGRSARFTTCCVISRNRTGKSLRVDEAKEFWEEYEAWATRIKVARKGNRPGDILVLAAEAPTRVFRIEAYRTAGKALLSLGQFKFALTQYENALAIRPRDLESRRQKGLLLGRLKEHDEARKWVEDLLKRLSGDAESWALLGRIEKDAWVELWRGADKTPEAMRRDAAQEEGMLRESIDAYATGCRKDPTHYYSGVNAVTLLYLQTDLTNKDERPGVRAEMEGGVRWRCAARWRRTQRIIGLGPPWRSSKF